MKLYCVGLVALIAAVLACVLMAGCGGPHNYRANITGASAATVDNYHTQGRGDEDSETADVTITPTASVGDTFAVTPLLPVPTLPTPPAGSLSPVPARTAPVPTYTPSAIPPTVDASVGPVHAVVGGQAITAPAGTTVTIHTAKRLAHAPEQTVRNRSAQGTGASIHTDATDGGAGFNAAAPTSTLKPVSNDGLGGGGGNSDGGETAFDWNGVTTAIAASVKGAGWLWFFGIGCMLAGIGYAVVERLIGGKTDWQLAIGMEVAGLSIIATAIVVEQHPVACLFLFLAIVGVIVWYVWTWYQKQSPAATGTPSTLSTLAGDAESAVEAEYQKLIGMLKPTPTAPPAASATPTA